MRPVTGALSGPGAARRAPPKAAPGAAVSLRAWATMGPSGGRRVCEAVRGVVGRRVFLCPRRLPASSLALYS